MFEHELNELEKKSQLRWTRIVEMCAGPRVVVDGKSLLLMCSNDYLGLAGHDALKKGAQAALDRYNFGAGASRLISGTSPLHEELETRTARFKGTQAALLFNSGYAANTGIIPALAGSGDTILSDSLNHASIIDGCRLSRARTLVYRHRDANHAESLLKSAAAGRRFIITDGVFSMDGDLAPLPDLVVLAERYDAVLIVDDAHGTGVMGSRGRGSTEHFHLEGRIPVQMGTFSKAFGSFGAFVAGDDDIIHYLINKARSFIFSTALPPAVCGASLAAIDIVEQDDKPKNRVWEARAQLLDGLERLGIAFGNTDSPIIPLVVGSSANANNLASRLFELGVFALAIRPPTVPEGTARIRLTVTALHSRNDIDTVVAAFAVCKQEGYL
ncbi:MAG TPA: 8-amino-7-oxononanoate synthase [Nitrospirota bacterium]|nr:8-amino-7-oxononanoate synthase [Nitrospirota bacterium]